MICNIYVFFNAAAAPFSLLVYYQKVIAIKLANFFPSLHYLFLKPFFKTLIQYLFIGRVGFLKKY